MRRYREILAGGLNVDAKDYFSRITSAVIYANFGNVLVDSKKFGEARQILEGNAHELKSLLSISDDPQPEFLLGFTETALARLNSIEASMQRSADRRIRFWQDADALFSDALSRFERIQRGIVLPLSDRHIVEKAREGSIQVKSQLAHAPVAQSTSL